ncbi:MAG: family 20 glycosylhydrolase [Lachnospiraceae bacterium]|nr:family 20 glycosylhydrolase [Lachnospiraceae bacterium]
MKKKTLSKHLWLKRMCCFILAFAMVFSSLTITPQAATATATTEEELIAKTNPILKSYDVSDAESVWTVTAGTRFVVEATGANIANERLAEVVKLINAEFVEKEIASTTPHTMVYGPAGSQSAADIMIRLVDVEDISAETTSEEAYKITINNLGVVVEAASENAAMYALRTIETMMITNNGLVYGTIVDYPDIAERRLHVDCGRKYFSKDWFIRQIREMSYLKLNAIQIHFAENLGFRIECETDPQIVSDEYLTKAEVREILAEAEKYGVKVIPSLDTPGHVQHILQFHPEYGQVDTSGNHSTTALDITNPEAVEYIYSLYDEYMELFEGCTDFHIGADEYMEYDRAPFTSIYKPVLDAYAVEKYGEGYTWREAMAGYTNDLAEHVYSKGFKPRIFNDGVYFNEGTTNQQKFAMHDYIGVDYWSRTSWIGGSPSLETFINRGHKEIYNFNSSYFYYVLRSGPQSDGRPANSFDVAEQYKNIYNNWTPGQFSGSTIADDHEVISGVSLGIWCDYPDTVTEDVVHTDIAKELRSLASKSWNTASNSILPYDDFAALTEEIGNVAGYEKGSELPEVGEFSTLENLGKVVIKYQDTEGNTIKADDEIYGELGTDYSFTAPAIYLWIATNADAVTGTYSETDGEIIFVYDIDPDPVMYASDMDTYPSVTEYLTTGGQFELTEASRLVIISSDQTLLNEVLENDLKLLSSEFTEVGLTETSMNIVYGTDETPKAGDIVIRIDEPSDDVSPEGYEITIKDYAEVSATGEAGIFYGIRTIQKTLLLNNGTMDSGKITDAPSVDVRGVHLDAARKYFTMDWIMALIKDLSYQNINTLQFHFSENEGYRLESSTLEEQISGWHYPSDGYYTKEDMLEIIAECQKYHIELVPSLDSPGHLQYVLDQFPNPAEWNCTSIWPSSSDFRSPQAFNIYEKEECRQFLKDLFTEYAEFFSEAGCKHFNIGGDEFLNNFGNMTNDQYVTVMNYFNEISALVKSYGLTPRAWNDGLMYSGYTGYTLDPDIEICYWSGPAAVATIEEFVANGNKVINMADVYMYYVLSSWWESNANPIGSKIFNEWTPGKLANSSRIGDQSVEYPYPDWLAGASFAIWCDSPSYRTQDQISTNIFMRTRAMAERSWNPNTEYTYSELESICNKLGHAPGYDGSELPAPGEIFSEGTLGTVILRYVDKDGNSLRNDRTVYGLIDSEYTITPDKLYGYRFVSMDKDAEGIYTEEEVLITLTYELYTDKAELQAAVDNAVKENDCIPGTYDNYGNALKEAKAVLADENATQPEVDEALEALTDAQEQTISLDRVDLYLEVTYPVGSAGYTAASYSNYTDAVTAGNTVLHQPNATEEEVAAALDNILAKKAALIVPTDLVSVTANKGTYSDWTTSYPLSNMLDGNPATKTWTNTNQATGDWFLFTFAKPVELNTFTIQFAENADCIHQADVAISADNSNWTEIGKIDNTGTPQYEQSFSANGETVQYVKITITKTVNNWTQIMEASFDYVLDETLDKSALETAIEAANALNKDDYSSASWKVLEAALENAEAANEKADITAGEVAAAANAVNGSIEALTAPGGETEENEVIRISGTTRYETGYKVADALKAELGVDKFDAVVVATGKNFADALAGSYLAVEKNAPIILTNGKDDNIAALHDYIKANVTAGGKVYILGGEGAVPAAVESITGYDVVRLAGKSRY